MKSKLIDKCAFLFLVVVFTNTCAIKIKIQNKLNNLSMPGFLLVSEAPFITTEHTFPSLQKYNKMRIEPGQQLSNVKQTLPSGPAILAVSYENAARKNTAVSYRFTLDARTTSLTIILKNSDPGKLPKVVFV